MKNKLDEDDTILVKLRQVEATDVSTIMNIVLPFRKIVCKFDQVYEMLHLERIQCDKSNAVLAVITASRGVSGFYIVGVAGFSNIDWISRHATLIFMMVDKEGHKSTMQNHQATSEAISGVLSWGFGELGLNRIEVEISEADAGLLTLEKAGFVVEGVRRNGHFHDGKYVNSIVLSMLFAEWISRKE